MVVLTAALMALDMETPKAARASNARPKHTHHDTSYITKHYFQFYSLKTRQGCGFANACQLMAVCSEKSEEDNKRAYLSATYLYKNRTSLNTMSLAISAREDWSS